MPPTQNTFSFVLGDDGSIVISLSPPIAIGGMAIDFNLMRRFGATPFRTLNLASGYGGGQSGLTVTNSGQGTIRIDYFGKYVSGLLYTNIASTLVRRDSGHITTMAEGYIPLLP